MAPPSLSDRYENENLFHMGIIIGKYDTFDTLWKHSTSLHNFSMRSFGYLQFIQNSKIILEVFFSKQKSWDFKEWFNLGTDVFIKYKNTEQKKNEGREI